MTERKIGLLLLTFLLMLVMIGAASAQSTGDGFVWDESTKTLTVTAEDILTIQQNLASYKAKAEKLVINTVGDIPTNAFKDFKAVSEIQIEHAGDIETRAFDGCGNSGSLMRNITIKKSGDIKQRAFYRLNGAGGTLTIMECGNIEGAAFDGAKLSGSVTIQKCGDIAANAFNTANANNNGVTSLSVGVCGNIGSNAFGGMKSSLQTAKIDAVNGAVSGYLFYSFSKLISVEIGSCGDIPANAFSYSRKLETLTIKKCGSIGNHTGLTALKSLKIGECTTIGNFYSFQPANTASLESIEIGKCESIASAAFQGGSSLKTIRIGACGEIKSHAFQDAKQLTTLEIGACDSVASFAFNAAGNAGSGIDNLLLENVHLDENAFGSSKINNLTLINNGNIGEQAFVAATIKNLTLSNITSLGSECFAYVKGLEMLTLENLDTISEDSFKIEDDQVNAVERITLRNVAEIGNYAFKNFSNLKNVIIEGSCDYVGAHAFSGCEKLETIDIADNTKLGYSDSFVNQPYVHDRVTAILQGGFALDSARKPVPIAPLGWTSYRTGEQNRAEQPGDTQLTKEARWINETCTTAEVLIQGYYTPNRQMDFIFVADCSNSMSGLGSADAMNSNFYNMQSKMMDVADVLLAADDLDTQVAFATFGETDSSVSRFFGKGESDAAKAYIWNDIVNYYSNTNYSAGLQAGLELVESNAGRNMTVIFLSDGQPYSSEDEIPASYYGRTEAAAIRSKGVKVLSVLQQVSQSELASSIANMEGVADQVFHSTDLEGFSKAVNSAIEYAYSTFILDDIVHPNFDLDTTSIKASAGTFKLGKDKNGNTVIRWDLSGHPFEKHTLSFKQNLLPGANGVYPSGNLDTNASDALLMSGGRGINSVKTPVLPREDSASPVAPPPKTGDDSQLFQWTLLLLLSAAVLATLLISRIKQRQKQ